MRGRCEGHDKGRKKRDDDGRLQRARMRRIRNVMRDRMREGRGKGRTIGALWQEGNGKGKRMVCLRGNLEEMRRV